MFKTILACAFIAIPAFQFAQDDRKIENDPKTLALLDKVSNNYHSSSSARVNFTLTVDSPEDDLFVESEGLVLLKDQKYRIDTEDMLIICDNVKRYVYLKESNELQINYFEPEENEIESPSELFDIYKNGYYYRTIKEATIDGRNIKVVELIPAKINESPYKKVHLHIDESKTIIAKAIIYSKDGITYTYGIKTFETNANLNDTEFSFDPSRYPGIYIDDMTK